ncbi:MFS transporter [Bacillus sp. FJAT-47783]|uniref:MFS transporter n=1 Tax=Bacillus sp. FJAT-47783 TaxID=2922712 RepID=UPI001FACFB08|nr:MFS transporter [Bacillus sp. FJAT-47783]
MEYTLSREERETKIHFYTFYFFVFFGFGSLFPLLSVYLKDVVGLTGSQIGIVMSISPVVMIIVQPIWGIISDATRKPVQIIVCSLLLGAVFGIVYSLLGNYYYIILIATLLAIVQSAIVPLSDSVAINYVQRTNVIEYGSIRLWGAVGFAVSALIVGWLSEAFHLKVIFYSFSIVLLIAAIFALQLPRESDSLQVSIRNGLAELKKIPQYFLFLSCTFLILGPILANNIYFGIFVNELGAGLAGVGLAFLLGAGSEAPFMKAVSRFIAKLGIHKVLILAALVSTLRWALYIFEPPLFVVYATIITQGFSIGLFIPAALQYVQEITPKSVGATAISIYSAIGNGLGNWFCTFIGGVILEAYEITGVYLFFAVLTLLGMLLLFLIPNIQKGTV